MRLNTCRKHTCGVLRSIVFPVIKKHNKIVPNYKHITLEYVTLTSDFVCIITLTSGWFVGQHPLCLSILCLYRTSVAYNIVSLDLSCCVQVFIVVSCVTYVSSVFN